MMEWNSQDFCSIFLSEAIRQILIRSGFIRGKNEKNRKTGSVHCDRDSFVYFGFAGREKF